jgi:hypothetical protein
MRSLEIAVAGNQYQQNFASDNWLNNPGGRSSWDNID